MPMIDKLTEEAQATGAVNTLTREGRRLVGHNTDVPGFDVALDKLVGRQKMPRQAVVLGAGGGARAVVYGLIRAGFQRIIVFNRHLHRAEGLVKHFGRSASHMDLKAMPWHESIIESELAKTKVLINATSIGLNTDVSPVPGEVLTGDLLVLDLIYNRTRLLRDAEAAGAAAHGRRDDAPPPGRRRVRAVDRPAGPARGHERGARRARAPRASGPRRASRRATPRRRFPRPRRRPADGRPRASTSDPSMTEPFRFLTAGESHGRTLGVIVEGVPAGLALTEADLAVDLARRQRGYGRGARQQIEHDRAEIVAGVRHGRTLGSPILLLVANRDWENWTRVMQVEPLSEEEAAALAAAIDGGDKRSTPVTRVRPGPRRPRRRAQVRPRRRAQRARARVRARDGGARRGGRRRAGVPARARHRRLVVHRRGRRRRGGPGAARAAPARRRTRRPCAARTPTRRRR